MTNPFPCSEFNRQGRRENSNPTSVKEGKKKQTMVDTKLDIKRCILISCYFYGDQSTQALKGESALGVVNYVNLKRKIILPVV